jgi:hypothetical protein
MANNERERDQSPDRQPPRPGDEAPAGTPGAAENVCRRCHGTGHLGEVECPDCNGTGKVMTEIGGA